LGRFEILLDDAPLRFLSKAPRRPLAILKALLSAGGRGMRQDTLQDALWPESDAALARRALNTTVYRLRRLLRHPPVVAFNDGWIALEPQLCWVDAWAFEEKAGQTQDPTALRAALGLYGGAFLSGSDCPLAFEARNRLRRKYIQAVLHVGQQHERVGDTGAAIELYETALDMDCTSEDVHRGLMRCLAREGKPAAVGAAYQRCRTMLWRHFAVGPSPATEQVYREAGLGRPTAPSGFMPRSGSSRRPTVAAGAREPPLPRQSVV
jgi:DNA-binding SARP family transcriptional activator